MSAVTVAEPTDGEQAFVSVVRLQSEESTSQIIDLVDQPFEPQLLWQSSPAPKDSEVLAAIAQLEDPPIVEPRDSSDEVSQFLHDAGLPKVVDVLGYSSIVIVQRAVRVTCENGGIAQGTLTTWTEPELGLVSCDERPAGTDPSDPAREAFRQYCGEA